MPCFRSSAGGSAALPGNDFFGDCAPWKGCFSCSSARRRAGLAGSFAMARAADYLHEIRPTLTLAAPIVVGQVSQMMMGVVDSAMIGHAGTVPRAASAFANNIF